MDDRRVALEHWAIATIHQIEEQSITGKMTSVSGDASFRRYFRLHYLGRSWIAVDAPADKEDNPKFVKIAQAWYQQGISVPKVIAYDFEQGFMLLEDFGSTLLWESLHAEGVSQQQLGGLYRQAIDLLLQIQPLDSSHLPAYDKTLLLNEMQLFTDWLCEKQLGIKLKTKEKQMFADCFELLAEQALKQPQATVHRDYHSRNLMVKEDKSLVLIDFQDAVVGPVTYDLVSLLRDCYVRWPEDFVDGLLAYSYELFKDEGLISSATNLTVFTQWFDLMGLQRHTKAAGIFARLHYRDGKSAYLNDIPLTLQYIIDVSARYEPLRAYSRWLEERVQPALTRKGELGSL